MNKKNLTYLIACFSILLIKAQIISGYTKKIRNNNFVFNDFIGKAEFITTRHCVTKHQPFQLPDGSHLFNDKKTKNDSYITIKAGRHASKKTATCVSETMLPGQDASGHFTFGHKPGSLNFAFQGTLIINDNVIFDDVILAQGHKGASNNWWFGGKHCDLYTNVYGVSPFPPENAVTCTSRTGQQWCFMRGIDKEGDLGPFGKFSLKNKPNAIDFYEMACEDLFSDY
ncbi:MAG: hypothetical protein OXC48_08255 [Endozoicomonadaceae bacterium]|nr:hypothetical protein [Endozoicomonadaceae bacterium]